MLYVDDRRIGPHGIGRFARQVLSGVDYRPISMTTDPDSPLDPMRLTLVLRKLSSGDLFFSPAYNPPLDCPSPFVFTLHDLNHIDRPENSSSLKRLYYATIVKRACRLASRILTVSEFSRRRIIDWSGVAPDKVLNVGNGVSSEFNRDVEAYQTPFRYVLCAGNRKGHKNELRQIESFARAKIASDIHLLLMGESTAGLADCMARNDVSERVHFLGHVPEDKLPSLYRSAEVLMFVSLYEGFGLPVLEAMACGTPVLTSNTTSLPEIAGNAALLVNPKSTEQIALGLENILSDTALKEQLRARGLKRAAQFTWAKTRSLVFDALEEAVGKKTSRVQ